jgi:CHASE1-domain containing sensor protein
MPWSLEVIFVKGSDDQGLIRGPILVAHRAMATSFLPHPPPSLELTVGAWDV